jgi:hypothetical protein
MQYNCAHKGALCRAIKSIKEEPQKQNRARGSAWKTERYTWGSPASESARVAVVRCSAGSCEALLMRPPVSTTTKSVEPQDARVYKRSRVTPG